MILKQKQYFKVINANVRKKEHKFIIKSFCDYFKYHQMTGTTQQNTKTPQVHIPAASAAPNSSVSVTLDPQAQLESDKRAVYRLVTFFMRHLLL